MTSAANKPAPRCRLPEHGSSCNGSPRYSVRRDPVTRLYHPARSCACGALRKLAPQGYPDFDAAQLLVTRLEAGVGRQNNCLIRTDPTLTVLRASEDRRP